MPYVHTDEMAVNGTPVSRKEDANMPIAIVGMACRFPGDATSPTRFFDMLTKGRAAWSEIPKDRYNVEAFWHPNDARQGTTTARGGHFMKEDLGLFDAPVGELLLTGGLTDSD
ncbi:hypothetical protein MMC14_007375 [Varicellaria rhodocarpa]|nr:hypothetical protein [Varicellaria rhodocarpa]